MNMIVSSAAFVGASRVASALPMQDAELDRLWLEREGNIRYLRDLSARRDEANRLLPDWAKPGATHVDFQGNRVGNVVGWPECADVTLPSFDGAFRRVRWSPYDIKEDFRTETRWLPSGPTGGAARFAARERYRRNMLCLVSRLREQRELEQSVSLTSIDSEVETLIDRQLKIEGEISRLPATVNQIIAWTIIRATWDESSGMSVNNSQGTVAVALVAMEGLRYQLTGAVRSSVDAAFDNPDTTFEDLNIIGI